MLVDDAALVGKSDLFASERAGFELRNAHIALVTECSRFHVSEDNESRADCGGGELREPAVRVNREAEDRTSRADRSAGRVDIQGRGRRQTSEEEYRQTVRTFLHAERRPDGAVHIECSAIQD